jgi:YesN/AraC family two-component response regulator
MEQRKLVLLVEDDGPLRKALRDALLMSDYNVIEASNYKETVYHLSKPIQFAVIDYSLPDRDGVEVLTSLRRQIPLVPAILITAYGTETIAVRAFKAGITDYIKKPFALSYLLQRVSEILNERQTDSPVAELREGDDFFIEYICLHIQRHFSDRNLTLTKAASLANMTPKRFSEVFKRKIGRSFVSYLNEIRLANAAELLINNIPIKEIAFLSGYRSAEYFDRLFKRRYGRSPGEYRLIRKDSR